MIKPSDAKECALQDDCVRKNPFDFKLNEVIENDSKEKVALTKQQE